MIFVPTVLIPVPGMVDWGFHRIDRFSASLGRAQQMLLAQVQLEWPLLLWTA